MPPLIGNLRRLRRRLAVFAWVDCATRMLMATLAAACIWLVLTRLFPHLVEALTVAAGLTAAVLAGALLWTWRRPPSLRDAALAADARLGLEERFTSSLALHEADGGRFGGSKEMAAALHADAERCLARLDHRRDFPFAPSRAMRWLAAVLMLFGVVYLLFPEVDLLGHQARAAQARVEQADREKKAGMLENAARLLPKPAEKEDSDLQAVARGLEDVAAAFQAGQATEKQALARVANLAEALRQQRDALAKKSGASSLQLTPRDMGLAADAAEALQRGRPADAAKALRALQEKLKEGGMSEAEKKELAEALKKLAESMSENDAAQQFADALSNAGADAPGGIELDAALEAMALSLSDMASVLEKMALLDAALQQMTEWQREQGGESSLLGKCSSCGAMRKPGECAGDACGACGTCEGSGTGSKPGWGTANETGELLADGEADFTPAVLPGALREGKMLMNLLQRAAPEAASEQARLEAPEPALVRVRQEAEQALTKEEVPPGAREFVRQYFGAIDSGE